MQVTIRNISPICFSCFVLVSVPFAIASADPIPIAYTQLSFRKGDLDTHCEKGIERAKAAGFNAIHLVPSFGWDESSKTIHAAPVLKTGEIRRCLEKAWDAGLHIIYKPHLENLDAMIGKGEMHWRAHFNVRPDTQYERLLYDELFEFLESKREEIPSSSRKIFVSMTGELERSPTERPEEWHQFYHRLKGRLRSLTLDQQVRVGMNPNGWPLEREYRYQSDGYQRLLSQVDFVAPSVYENWSQTDLQTRQIHQAMTNIPRRLHRGAPFSSFAFGEFGVGGRFDKSHAYDPPPKEGRASDAYMKKRRALYENLFKYLQSGEGAKPEYLAIWTIGAHDPVGIFDLSETLPDPEIANQIRSYTQQERAIVILSSAGQLQTACPAP